MTFPLPPQRTKGAPSLLETHPLVQPGHAEGGGGVGGRAGAGGDGAVTGLAAVVLDLQHAQLLVGEVRVDLAQVSHDDEPVGHGQENHVRGLQEARDAQSFETIKGLKWSEGKSSANKQDTFTQCWTTYKVLKAAFYSIIASFWSFSSHKYPQLP